MATKKQHVVPEAKHPYVGEKAIVVIEELLNAASSALADASSFAAEEAERMDAAPVKTQKAGELMAALESLSNRAQDLADDVDRIFENELKPVIKISRQLEKKRK